MMSLGLGAFKTVVPGVRATSPAGKFSFDACSFHLRVRAQVPGRSRSSQRRDKVRF